MLSKSVKENSHKISKLLRTKYKHQRRRRDNPQAVMEMMICILKGMEMAPLKKEARRRF
jgi:hypothetical protein